MSRAETGMQAPAPTPRPRVLLVGADGVIGRHVHALIAADHDVVTAGLDQGDIVLDLANADAVVRALEQVGRLDAVISTAGRARFAPLDAVAPAALTESVYGLGLLDKLMGQVNLALAARPWLSPGGSITLTSGTTSEDPIPGGSSLSMVNGALERWVRAAATEWPHGLRINIVSPSLVEGTPARARAAFAGFELVGGERVARAYLRALKGGITGQVLRVA